MLIVVEERYRPPDGFIYRSGVLVLGQERDKIRPAPPVCPGSEISRDVALGQRGDMAILLPFVQCQAGYLAG